MAKHSAYEVSKRVFKEHYVPVDMNYVGNSDTEYLVGHKGRTTDLYDFGGMWKGAIEGDVTENFDYRASIDLIFLAIFVSKARENGDDDLADKAVTMVNYSVNKLDEKINDIVDQVSWSDGLHTFYLIRATAIITYYMRKELSSETRKKVRNLRMKSINRSMELYETSKWGGIKVKKIVQDKIMGTDNPAGGDVQPGTVINVLSVLASGLALNSYLVGYLTEDYDSPTDNKYRYDLSEIGTYLMKSCYEKDGMAQCNYGSSEPNRGEYAITGYSSWVASNLSLIAHGTIFVDNPSEVPDSDFANHVPKMFKAFRYTQSKFGYTPDTFKGFGDNDYEYQQDDTYPKDVTAQLYNFAYYGEQKYIDWIDYVTKVNALGTGNDWKTNGTIIRDGEAVIEGVIRRDMDWMYQDTAQAFFTRGVESLAAGMMKEVMFNDSGVTNPYA